MNATTAITLNYCPVFTFGNGGKPRKHRGLSVFTTKLPSFSIRERLVNKYIYINT